MLINTDYIPPAELTGFAREALVDLEQNQFTLSEFLPSTPVDDLQYRFNRGGAGLAEAATFRAFYAESSIGKRPGTTRVTGDLPPVSRKIRLGEYDRLRQRKADESIRGGLFDDTVNMVTSVAARLELARGSALAFAKVSLAEDGVFASADFGRRASHSGVAPAVLWTNSATSTPIADIIAWVTTWKKSNGGKTPGAFLTSQTILSNILRSQEVRGLAAANGVTPSIISPLVLNTILQAYSLPPIVVNDAEIVVNGVSTRVIPENNFLILPGIGNTQLGGTFWGTTAESLEEDYDLAGNEPGIVAGAYHTFDPVAVWTKASAIALPVLANPDLTFQAVVI